MPVNKEYITKRVVPFALRLDNIAVVASFSNPQCVAVRTELTFSLTLPVGFELVQQLSCKSNV